MELEGKMLQMKTAVVYEELIDIVGDRDRYTVKDSADTQTRALPVQIPSDVSSVVSWPLPRLPADLRLSWSSLCRPA